MGVHGRKRAVPVIIDVGETSEYEQLREKRIKENQERMEKLGILDISLKLKSFNNNKRTSTPTVRKTPQRFSPLQPSQQPPRRSSRLQSATPVSYSEVHSKIDKSLEGERHLLREEGSRPEIYTEEHEKMLGTTDLSWTLFVDGYGNDGKRIYDPIKGKTCHQCRQKTLGHRTHCSQCNLVQGQFCGDCLFMRYGEHVLEAKQNPNWICPPCRGICNCSLCRQAKGWAPTGPLYKKIANLGYKSVAHYLIQTHLANVSSEKNSASAKRSLPFSDMEATVKDDEFCNSDFQGQLMTTTTVVKTVESSTGPPLAFAAESSMEPLLSTKSGSENSGTDLVLSCDDVGHVSVDKEPKNEHDLLLGSALTSSAPVLTELNDAGKNLSNQEKEDDICVSDDKNCDNKVTPESSIEPLLKLDVAAESSVEPLLPMKHDCESSGTDLALSCDSGGDPSGDNEPGSENAMLVGSAVTSCEPVLTKLNDDCKAESQLGNEVDAGKGQSKEEKEGVICVSDDETCDGGIVAPEARPKSKKKPLQTAAEVTDSIAGRLRQRRGRGNAEA